MEYKLKKPILLYSEADGKEVLSSLVTINYVGCKGFIQLSRLQDIVGKVIQQAVTTQSNSKDKTEDITNDDITDQIQQLKGMLLIYGSMENISVEILQTLKENGNINECKLSGTIQDRLDIKDIEGLVDGVLNNFLLPGILGKLKSLKN